MVAGLKESPAGNLAIRQFNTVLRAVFLIWIGIGLAPIQPSNEIPFLICDIIFIASAFFALVMRPIASPKSYVIVFVILVYVLLDLFALYVKNLTSVHPFSLGLLQDFLYSDKYFIYLMLIGVFSAGHLIEPRTIRILMYALLFGSLFKYGYFRLFRLDDRPELLLENNYEQMMLLTLFVVFAIMERWRGRRAPHYMVGLLVLTVALSGSRSAIAALMPVLAFLYVKPTRANFVVVMTIAPLALLLVMVIFESRIGASGKIDRVVFFDVFLREVDRFAFWNFLIGMKPLSPLSAGACQQLAYYKTLFSAQNNGHCYAVVFHSYMLRALHDHGILGCILPFVAIFYFLPSRIFRRREKLTLIAIGFLCGFSVSGIGANFVAFPLALASALRVGEGRGGKASRGGRGLSNRPLFPPSGRWDSHASAGRLV